VDDDSGRYRRDCAWRADISVARHHRAGPALFIAAWSIVTGAFKVAAATRLRKEIKGEWLLGLAGVASMIFGILLVALPGPGALALIWLIGADALVFGVLMLVLTLRLRSGREPMGHHAAGAA
jgi:uncharacterized membrane protein HdeD (DUF308 family)